MTQPQAAVFHGRREHRRYERQAKVVISQVSGENVLVSGELVNISLGGILVRTEHTLSEFSRVWVQIHVGHVQVVNAVARLHQIRPEGSVYCFTYLPSRSKRVLDWWLGGGDGRPPVAGIIG